MLSKFEGKTHEKGVRGTSSSEVEMHGHLEVFREASRPVSQLGAQDTHHRMFCDIWKTSEKTGLSSVLCDTKQSVILGGILFSQRHFLFGIFLICCCSVDLNCAYLSELCRCDKGSNSTEWCPALGQYIDNRILAELSKE